MVDSSEDVYRENLLTRRGVVHTMSTTTRSPMSAGPPTVDTVCMMSMCGPGQLGRDVESKQ